MLLDKPTHTRHVLGIMSGTSLDGVDLSIARFEPDYRLAECQSSFADFPGDLRESLLQIASSDVVSKQELKSADTALGKLYADVAEEFVRSVGGSKFKVDLIGNHGQTVFHRTGDRHRQSLTMQIGASEFLCQALKAPVIHDFRASDIAAGGRGAPLTPIAHHYLFARARKRQLVLNIGGISNVTYLPGKGPVARIQATDCGPGNMILDQVAAAVLGKQYDKDGAAAKSGTVNRMLLARLKRMGFLRKNLPIALGREQFNDDVMSKILGWASDMSVDTSSLMSTLLEFTVFCVERVVRKYESVSTLLVCGGGRRNGFLMERLRETCNDITVVGSETEGIDPDYVEAVSFALLANLAADGVPGNLPQVTGAERRVVLGKVSLF